MVQRDEVFDVCIIGSGPAGLAALSALHSPYSLEGMTEAQEERAAKAVRQQRRKKVCVVGDGWLRTWQSNFDRLSIEYLRSPALAHPDLFDPHALLSYAVREGREDELLESGCGDMKSLLALGQSQVGLWKLPSTKLFVDFCLDLSKTLPHNFVDSKVVDMERDEKCDRFGLQLRNGGKVQAKAVVLAIGAAGKPIVPRGLEKVRCSRHWNEPEQPRPVSDLPTLVVGGGLTAVQVALRLLNTSCVKTKGPRVILVSKRPLVEKHFDIKIEWFDRRTTNKCMADFYSNSMKCRKQALKEARRGGSVPPLYMRQVGEAEQKGSLLCLIGDTEAIGDDHTNTRIQVRYTQKEGHSPVFDVNEIVFACGVQPDCCNTGSLTELIKTKWPTCVEGGMPCITQDLRWRKKLDLFVVGSLGALNIGPDAGNLMGIRRAAQIVANALGSRSWLRESVLGNAFVLLEDSSDDESSSDEELFLKESHCIPDEASTCSTTSTAGDSL